MNGSREVWITDPNHPKFQKIKANFVELMQEHTKELKINYYDFLLVAKKMAFRFEESAHLMALKNFFAKNRNSIPLKRIADALSVSQDSLNMQEDKVIVKFNVPDTEFAPIKEETLEDDELAEESDNEEDFKKMGSNITQDQEKEINEKIAIILSIKIDEMEQKLQQVLAREPDSIFSLFGDCEDEINYDRFKKGFLSIVTAHKERIRISEDDIKTIFYILDEPTKGFIDLTSLAHLKNLHWVLDKMREFYKARINRDMVKNTLFKLGRIKNNSIQIYQVKNASLLEFENIERSMLPENEHRKHINSIRMRKSKPPHFGPLKGAVLANRKQKMKANTIYHSNQQIRSGEELKVERQKIQRILKLSKEEKHRDKGGDTVASKLRSLFIHKVILPREKMLEEEKERYLKNRTVESDLFVKAHR